MGLEELKKKLKNPYVLCMVFVFIAIWITASITAFAMSIRCFKHSGTRAQHTLGVTIFAIFGPLYWIYYLFAKDYCR